jgi:hypothetical protein
MTARNAETASPERTRSREEEELVRRALPELSRAFPGALVMRNEANACMSLLRACQRETAKALGGDVHTLAVVQKAINTAFGMTPDAIKYGLGVGSADVIVCHEGSFIAEEFKSEKGRLSEDQERWGSWVERAGGLYMPVRSVSEAIEAVRRRGQA